MLNNPFRTARARALVARLTGETPGARIAAAYRLLHGRLPAGPELEAGLAFLARDPAGGPPPPAAWEEYAQVLLSSNEFLFVR